ncbi:hypothetical protein BX666DRAFT_503286 [Dichotomocladium elegans]|nr:hypothetical protein BX666DRAFT_503286 [Dichotomocladium elegans]
MWKRGCGACPRLVGGIITDHHPALCIIQATENTSSIARVIMKMGPGTIFQNHISPSHITIANNKRSMSLLNLPAEILLIIFYYLTPRSICRLLSVCRTFGMLRHNEQLWQELARRHGIIYRHPRQKWWELFATGDLFTICPHIHDRQLLASLKDTSLVFWQRAMESSCCDRQERGMCLEPGCHFIGHLREHYHATEHAYVLKLSPLHFLEIWCYACNKPVGFWGFPSIQKPMTERYLVRRVIQQLTHPPWDHVLASRVIRWRRAIERKLMTSQRDHLDCYIVERGWFLAWNDFIRGDVDNIPAELPNHILFDEQDDLKPSIQLGKDFELVGGLLRSYIERVYGVQGIIVSGCKDRGQNVTHL